LAVVVVLVLLGPVPHWMLGHGPRSYRRCLLRNATPLPGADMGKCLFAAKAWLWWPSLLPWSRSDAVRKRHELVWVAVGHRLQEASKLRPSRSARSAAAEAMASIVRSAPPSSPATARAFGASLWQVGAWPELVRHVGLLGDRMPYALDAALLTGRLQEATAIGLRADWQTISVPIEQQLRRGAWLCLNGQQAALAVLRAVNRKRSLVGRLDAGLVLRLCGAVLNNRQPASARPSPDLALDTPSWLRTRGDEQWLASVAASATSSSKAARLTLQLAQAMSFVQNGQLKQAEQLAAEAYRRSRADAELAELSEPAAWIRLAAALRNGHLRNGHLRNGHSLEQAALPTPIVYGGASQHWARLATMIEQKRATIRWRMFGATGEPPVLVLPAAMYVVAQAAAGAGDVDVWLDAFFHNRTVPFRVHARARAEAARWRGHQQDAARWDRAADELSGVITSAARRALADAAGL